MTLTRLRAQVLALARREWVMWLAFIAVSTWLALIARYGALGDADNYYHPHAVAAVFQGNWPGIQSPSVYPILATVPMVVPLLLPSALYDLGWILLIELLNAVAFFFLLRELRSRGRVFAAWWWIVFMELLGAISVTRLDSVAVPLCIVALLFALTRPRLSAAVLTVATWIKVWPAAIIAAMLAAEWRWKTARMVVGISVTIVLVALILGGGLNGSNIASFVTSLGSRGLEIGAPVSGIWLWMAAAGVPHTAVYYNQVIEAFEIRGPGSTVAGVVTTCLTILSVAALILLVIRARRRGVDHSRLLALAALGLLVDVIVFNKVGSPQYIEMLAVPVVVGLVWDPRRFALPAVLGATIAFLTQLTFPWFFMSIVTLQTSMLVLLTIRNVLLVTLLIWAAREIWRAEAPDDRSPEQPARLPQPALRSPKARR